MKRILSILMALALLLGCVSFASADEPVTIRFAWWGGQARHDSTMKALEDFMAKNPDIKVEVEFTGYGEHFQKLATQAAGGMLPDLIQMDYAYLKQYAENGVIEDLTPYIESGALNLADVPMSTLDGGKVGEGMYGLSTGSNAQVLAYRTDVLAEAGLTMPQKPTMTEYYELIEKVYAATGRTNSYTYINVDNGLNFILRNYGLDLYNADNTALGFDDPKYLVFMWEKMLEGYEAGWELPLDAYTAVDAYSQLDKDTWSTWITSNGLASYASGSNCELGLAMIPQMDDATVGSTFFKPSMLWSMNAKSENKDAVIRLINYLTNDTDYFDIVGMDRGLPVSTKIQEHLVPTLDANTKQVVTMLNYLAEEGNTSPIAPPYPSCHNDVSALFNTYREEVAYGLVEKDGLTAHAQKFIDEANAIIARSLAQ